MVGSIVTVLPLGKLYGKYNAKWLYVISVILFLASSALCGAAPNMNAMIVGRVFLGMAGNGIYFGILVGLSIGLMIISTRNSYLIDSTVCEYLGSGTSCILELGV